MAINDLDNIFDRVTSFKMSDGISQNLAALRLLIQDFL